MKNTIKKNMIMGQNGCFVVQISQISKIYEITSTYLTRHQK